MQLQSSKPTQAFLEDVGVLGMRNVLDAIRDGDWYFEPDTVEPTGFQSTSAIPGTKEKLSVLADRVLAGLPLWHASDRSDYEENEDG